MRENKTWKSAVSWAMYDWANSAFATTVMAGFFPLFFKKFWSAGVDPAHSTFNLGLANSGASLVIALAAPLLGAAADKGNFKKKFLFLFTCLGVLATGLLFWVGKGQWAAAAGLYTAATIGFSGANIFYDSLLISVADESRVDFVSALGYSLGYLGGGILFALNVAMTLSPQTFAIAGDADAVRFSFLTVSAWWLIFSAPLFLWVRERRDLSTEKTGSPFSAGIAQLRATFTEIRRLRVVFLFLIGYWLYIDGVDTIVRMAVDYGLSLGLDSKSLIKALLVTQFVGFPSALAFGKLGEIIGAKRGVYLAIAVYICVTFWAYFIKSEADFMGLAVVIGLVQGGVQSLSRSFYTRIIPANKAAEFFGFYNMLGKFAAVLGPLLMGWVGLVSGSSRNSVFAVTALLVAGGLCLCFVDEKRGRIEAQGLEKI